MNSWGREPAIIVRTQAPLENRKALCWQDFRLPVAARGAALTGHASHSLVMSAVEVMFPLLLSFGAFAVFVWVARCAVASPSFRPDSSALTRLVHACVAERPAHAKRCQALSQKEQPGAAGAQAPDSFATDAGRLALCTAGIQVSYLVWGLMQERIMTRKYSSGDLFTSSKFLSMVKWQCPSAPAWLPGCPTAWLPGRLQGCAILPRLTI